MWIWLDVKLKPQQVQLVRGKSARVDVVKHWFIVCLKPTLDQLNLHDCLELIFNMDVAGFPLSGRPSSVLVRQRIKSLSSSSSVYNPHKIHHFSLLSAISISQQLCNFFVQLLNSSQTSSHCQASAHGFTGLGENLTNEEAKERVRIAEEKTRSQKQHEDPIQPRASQLLYLSAADRSLHLHRSHALVLCSQSHVYSVVSLETKRLVLILVPRVSFI